MDSDRSAELRSAHEAGSNWHAARRDDRIQQVYYSGEFRLSDVPSEMVSPIPIAYYMSLDTSRREASWPIRQRKEECLGRQRYRALSHRWTMISSLQTQARSCVLFPRSSSYSNGRRAIKLVKDPRSSGDPLFL
jgi:hypothetical protein